MASGAPQTMQLHKNTSDLLSISGEARQLGKSSFADIVSVFRFTDGDGVGYHIYT